MALKTSGWDGILVKGKSSSPAYLVIDSKGVTFKNAAKLWKKDTQKTQELLEKEGSGSIVIGPAGENMVRYANLCSGHRFLGRGGMGAVMGSKNLKAIAAKGNEFKIRPKNQKKFDNQKKKLNSYINSNQVTSDLYRNYGTNSHVKLSNAAWILPVRNFTKGTHGEAHKIYGETMKEKFNTKYNSCKPCSILCGHKGNIDGKERPVPEYETVGLLGANLEIFDPLTISEWNEICSQMGMDTISAGGTIAWAMEAAEAGLIKTDLKFGSPNGVSKILKDIAQCKGFGKDLAMGSKWLSKKYGGEHFAIHVKGLELPAYDPRGSFGQGLSFAVANRGACHLASASFSLEAYFNMASPKAARGKATLVKFFENIYSAVNSMHICQFTAYAQFLEPPLVKFSPVPVLKQLVQNITPVALALMDISGWPKIWSSITGINIGMQKFKKIGERITVLERYMNTREGISRKDDTLPDRFLFEGRKCDPKERTVPLAKMLNKYYKVRGYDKNGIPKISTLKRLGIEVR